MAEMSMREIVIREIRVKRQLAIALREEYAIDLSAPNWTFQDALKFDAEADRLEAELTRAREAA